MPDFVHIVRQMFAKCAFCGKRYDLRLLHRQLLGEGAQLDYFPDPKPENWFCVNCYPKRGITVSLPEDHGGKPTETRA